MKYMLLITIDSCGKLTSDTLWSRINSDNSLQQNVLELNYNHVLQQGVLRSVDNIYPFNVTTQETRNQFNTHLSSFLANIGINDITIALVGAYSTEDPLSGNIKSSIDALTNSSPLLRSLLVGINLYLLFHHETLLSEEEVCWINNCPYIKKVFLTGSCQSNLHTLKWTNEVVQYAANWIYWSFKAAAIGQDTEIQQLWPPPTAQKPDEGYLYGCFGYEEQDIFNTERIARFWTDAFIKDKLGILVTVGLNPAQDMTSPPLSQRLVAYGRPEKLSPAKSWDTPGSLPWLPSSVESWLDTYEKCSREAFQNQFETWAKEVRSDAAKARGSIVENQEKDASLLKTCEKELLGNNLESVSPGALRSYVADMEDCTKKHETLCSVSPETVFNWQPILYRKCQKKIILLHDYFRSCFKQIPDISISSILFPFLLLVIFPAVIGIILFFMPESWLAVAKVVAPGLVLVLIACVLYIAISSINKILFLLTTWLLLAGSLSYASHTWGFEAFTNIFSDVNSMLHLIPVALPVLAFLVLLPKNKIVLAGLLIYLLCSGLLITPTDILEEWLHWIASCLLCLALTCAAIIALILWYKRKKFCELILVNINDKWYENRKDFEKIMTSIHAAEVLRANRSRHVCLRRRRLQWEPVSRYLARSSDAIPEETQSAYEKFCSANHAHLRQCWSNFIEGLDTLDEPGKVFEQQIFRPVFNKAKSSLELFMPSERSIQTAVGDSITPYNQIPLSCTVQQNNMRGRKYWVLIPQHLAGSVAGKQITGVEKIFFPAGINKAVRLSCLHHTGFNRFIQGSD